MARWLKRELVPHLMESHPHSAFVSVVSYDVLFASSMTTLLRSHMRMHGLDPWGRHESKDQPHGPEEEFGHD